jgi:hypothetical protein
MDRQHLTEWIDQYLLDELKEEELNQFRQRLQTDADFRQEVERQQAVFLQARKVGREALRGRLKEMHQRLALPWPVENVAADGPAAPQPEQEAEQDRVARGALAAMVAYLALWQAQFRHRRVGRFSWYTITASISLLLSASIIAYFLYWGNLTLPTARRSGPGSPLEASAQLAYIQLESGDGLEEGSRGLGLGGPSDKDTAVAVLIYPAPKGPRTYRFDDTLRLYGAFVPARLALRFQQETARYSLREDSLLYLLERFQPRQALQPAP